MSSHPPEEAFPGEGQPKKRRTWKAKFEDAFRGLGFGVRGQSSFAVHVIMAMLVIITAVVLRCDPVQWCLLIGCIGLVLTAELFNTAIETLFRELDEATRERAWPCLDIAAGAVFVASLTASIIGVVIFGSRLFALLDISILGG